MFQKIKLLFLISFLVILSGCSSGGEKKENIVESGHIVGGVVPHHLAARGLIENFLEGLKTSEPNLKTFIIVGPNHFEAGDSNILHSNNSNSEIENIFAGEHSWKNLEPAIKTYFPESNIEPIILKAGTTDAEIDALVSELRKRLADEENIFVLGSIDFSHYLTSQEAEVNDKITKAAIETRDLEKIKKFNNDYVDSPPTLLTMLKLFPDAEIEFLENTNSGLISGDLNSSTTSYFTLYFTNTP